MREEPPLSIHDSPLHNEEEVPSEFEMVNVGEQNKNKEKFDIIKEKEAQIRELKYDLSKANFMVAFLQQENRQLRQNLM